MLKVEKAIHLYYAYISINFIQIIIIHNLEINRNMILVKLLFYLDFRFFNIFIKNLTVILYLFNNIKFK